MHEPRMHATTLTNMERAQRLTNALKEIQETNAAQLITSLMEHVQGLESRIEELEQAGVSRATNVPRLLTIRQFTTQHPWATAGGLRHLIFFADTNGFKECIVRMGRRLLLDESKVFTWIRQDRENPKKKP